MLAVCRLTSKCMDSNYLFMFDKSVITGVGQTVEFYPISLQFLLGVSLYLCLFTCFSTSVLKVSKMEGPKAKVWIECPVKHCQACNFQTLMRHETFGPMVDFPHLYVPLRLEQSRTGHSATILPVSHAFSYINQKGCEGCQRSLPSRGTSCVWDEPCFHTWASSHTVFILFALQTLSLLQMIIPTVTSHRYLHWRINQNLFFNAKYTYFYCLHQTY